MLQSAPDVLPYLMRKGGTACFWQSHLRFEIESGRQVPRQRQHRSVAHDMPPLCHQDRAP